MYQTRLLRLRNLLRERNLDALALVPGTSMVYLTGIHSHLSERPTVVFLSADSDPVAIIPRLEAMKAEAAGVPADRIFAWTDEDGYAGAFAGAARLLNLNGSRLGIEALKMRVLEADVLQEVAGGVRLHHADDVTATLRLSKDRFEIEQMQQAVYVAEDAFRKLLPTLRVGLTEKEIAGLMLLALLESGAEKLAFEPIVSAGPNGASPHAVPTDRPIAEGDLLILDWGAQVGDYVSDITRTLGVGHVSAESRAIYEAVRAANAAGVAAARPGVSGAAIDQAARAVIEAAGYGPFFIHRTGHGLGMEAHESPSLVAGNHEPLPVGAAFTVEPGIYLPGRGGVRIEDDVVITSDGHRCLTTLPREFITIG